MFGNQLYNMRADDFRVKQAVTFLQSLGAPKDVKYLDGETEWGFPFHLVQFYMDGRMVYEAQAGPLWAYPQISFTEMKSLGVIR